MVKSPNSKNEMLATALVSFILILLAAGVNIAVAFLEMIISWVSPGTIDDLNMIKSVLVDLGLPFELIRTWVDAVEIAADITMAVVAYARYTGRI